MTGVASIYGEMGYLAERSSLKIPGVIISIVMMSVCFILVVYFQAEITKIMLTKDSTSIDHYNIGKLKLLGHANNADVLKVKRYGAKVKEMECAIVKDTKSFKEKLDILKKKLRHEEQVHKQIKIGILSR